MEFRTFEAINQRSTCLAVVLLVISSNTDVIALIYSVSLDNCWHSMVFERHQTSQALGTFILRRLLFALEMLANCVPRLHGKEEKNGQAMNLQWSSRICAHNIHMFKHGYTFKSMLFPGGFGP
jgi:hypothetical protein